MSDSNTPALFLTREEVMIRLKQLPSLPTAVSEALTSFAQEDVDVDRGAHLIALDQGLTARVLRVANSSFYGLQNKVGTIHEAVVVLGFRAVRSMVLAVGLNGAFRVDQCRHFDAQGYLRHSTGVGLVARALAPRAGHNPELAFTAGLLHDVGRLVLAANFSSAYAQVLRYRNQHDCPLVVAERDLLGLDHAVVGGLLAEAWHFPLPLQEAALEHHTPAAATAGSMANLIHVADVVAHALAFAGSPDEMVPPLDRVAWERVKGDWLALRQALPGIEAAFADTCQAMTI